MMELNGTTSHVMLGIGLVFWVAACEHKHADRALAGRSALPPSSAAPAASTAFYANRFGKKPSVSAMTEVGRKLFFDPSLSASKKMACASCHDPKAGYGPSDDASVELGGVDMKSPGVRAVPPLRYLQIVPPFSEHHFDEAVDESVDQGPTGGHGWDGRADTAHEQARLPLTSPFEMANPSLDDVVVSVEHAAYADQVKQAFGDDVFADRARATAAVLMALEVFQQSPSDFYPYSSRYDAWLRHQGDLTPRERRGLSAFEDPKKGNCASCHPSQVRKGAFPQFTDFGFVALGAPRNAAIPANRDPTFYDLGLCGPMRTDLTDHKEYCGAFRAPTLRNVAVRRVFFHNGVFHTLKDVVHFYAERDTKPSRWYPKAPDGRVVVFDDLPEEDRKNVHREPPFGRKVGERPLLDDGEISDIVVFLETLTDADLVGAARR